MSKSNRLLFISYYFPPCNVIASNRSWNIAKYLVNLGWSITVLTLHPKLWRYINNPFDSLSYTTTLSYIYTKTKLRFLTPDELIGWNSNIGKFIGGILRTINKPIYIDNCIGWIPDALYSCRDIKTNDYDIILSTASPFSSFIIADILSKKLKIPYVIDYRDGWTIGNPHILDRYNKSMFKEYVKYTENRIINNCSAISIVSPSLCNQFNKTFYTNNKVNVITNGYDNEELNNVIPINFDHFAIVYTGQLYPPLRIIDPIMKALSILNNDINCKYIDWMFHYYGPNESSVNTSSKKYNLQSRVISHGIVPRKVALSATAGANVSIVITSINKSAGNADQGIITGKIFEPIGLKVPILLIAPDNSDAEAIITSCLAGKRFSSDDTDNICRYLISLMQHPNIPTGDNSIYSWKLLSLKYHNLLTGLL